MSNSHQATRRQFLQGVAAAGAASVFLPSAGRALGYQSPNDRPVFATIGLRNQGWAITSKTFKFADFAALADVDSNVLAANVEKTEQKQGKKPDAYKDYRKILERINKLIKEIQRSPFEGTGKPEPLRHGLSGYWSRRITDEHRIVYKVEKDSLHLAQLRYHY